MEAKQKALKMCQAFGITTLFAQDCNGGVTLPLSIAKKCAIIAVDEIIVAIGMCSVVAGYPLDYWEEVKLKIEML